MTSDTADRNTSTPDNTQSGAKGRLFDATFYQAWALDESGTWHYLPSDGSPDAPADPSGATWRERVRAGALRCPFPGCGVAYSSIRRGAGRVAFVHPKAGGTHNDKQSKETLWRLAARQSVAHWASARFPGATVHIDGADEGGDLPVAPDVLIAFPDGGRLAVECRYAAFTADEWRERHEAYQKEDIADVWLLGNSGPLARKATGDTDLRRPPAAVSGALADGASIHWLNPFLDLIGTPAPAEAAGTVAVAQSPIADWVPPGVGGTGEPAAPEEERSSTGAAPGDGVLAAAPAPAGAVEESAGTATALPEPAVTEPVAAEPTATEPTATEPTATEPAVTEPPVVEVAEEEAGPEDGGGSEEVPQAAEQEAAAEGEQPDERAAAGAEPADDAPLDVAAPAPPEEEPEAVEEVTAPAPASPQHGQTRPSLLRRLLGRLRRPAA